MSNVIANFRVSGTTSRLLVVGAMLHLAGCLEIGFPSAPAPQTLTCYNAYKCPVVCQSNSLSITSSTHPYQVCNPLADNGNQVNLAEWTVGADKLLEFSLDSDGQKIAPSHYAAGHGFCISDSCLNDPACSREIADELYADCDERVARHEQLEYEGKLSACDVQCQVDPNVITTCDGAPDVAACKKSPLYILNPSYSLAKIAACNIYPDDSSGFMQPVECEFQCITTFGVSLCEAGYSGGCDQTDVTQAKFGCEPYVAISGQMDPPLESVVNETQTTISFPHDGSSIGGISVQGGSVSTVAAGFGSLIGQLPCASYPCTLMMGIAVGADDVSSNGHSANSLSVASGGGGPDFPVILAADGTLTTPPGEATFTVHGEVDGQEFYQVSTPDTPIVGSYDSSSRALSLGIQLDLGNGVSLVALLRGHVGTRPPIVVPSPIFISTNATSPAGASVTLSASASAPDGGGIVGILWTETSPHAAFAGNQASVQVTAPLFTSIYDVAAWNSNLQRGSGFVIVNVLPVPPVAIIQPSSISTFCTAPGGSNVLLDGSHSTWVDAPISTYSWQETDSTPPTSLGNSATIQVFAPVGTTHYQLKVVDTLGLSGAANGNVNIVEQPPTANAGPDQKVECNSHQLGGSSAVQLDGSASTDPFGRSLSYAWTIGDKQIATGVQPTVLLADNRDGVPYTITLTVTDPCGVSTTSATHVLVTDTVPPTLAATSTVACLWSPNHDFVELRLGQELPFTVSDACDPNPIVTISNVTSSEAVNAAGSGNTAPDYVFNSTEACLRAERSGKGHGREYDLTIEAKDFSENSSNDKIIVDVPHDQSGHPQCVSAVGVDAPSSDCSPAVPSDTSSASPPAQTQPPTSGNTAGATNDVVEAGGTHFGCRQADPGQARFLALFVVAWFMLRRRSTIPFAILLICSEPGCQQGQVYVSALSSCAAVCVSSNHAECSDPKCQTGAIRSLRQDGTWTEAGFIVGEGHTTLLWKKTGDRWMYDGAKLQLHSLAGDTKAIPTDDLGAEKMRSGTPPVVWTLVHGGLPSGLGP